MIGLLWCSDHRSITQTSTEEIESCAEMFAASFEDIPESEFIEDYPALREGGGLGVLSPVEDQVYIEALPEPPCKMVYICKTYKHASEHHAARRCSTLAENACQITRWATTTPGQPWGSPTMPNLSTCSCFHVHP